jgi:anti-sigma factor RsiW
MNCGRVSNLLSAFADRELTGADMLQIRRHLNDCADCQAEYEALCRMKMMLGRLRAPTPPSGFVATTLQCFHAASVGSEERGAARARPGWEGMSTSAGRWPVLRLQLSALLEHARAAGTVSPPLRLKIGLLAAGLAAALVVSGIGLLKPRHSDALVATIPRFVLQGQESLDTVMTLDGRFVRLPVRTSAWGPLSQGPSSLDWVTISLQRTDVGR